MDPLVAVGNGDGSFGGPWDGRVPVEATAERSQRLAVDLYGFVVV